MEVRVWTKFLMLAVWPSSSGELGSFASRRGLGTKRVSGPDGFDPPALKLMTQGAGSQPGSEPAEPFDRLLSQARNGDERAIEQLYLNHMAIVYGYFKACGAPEPEDLTSDVFLGMLRNLGKFTGGQPEFRRWLMTIAYRRLIDNRRRRRLRTRDRPTDPLNLPDETGAAGATELQATIVDPQLTEAFIALTPAQREVLALRFVADVSLQEVAEITGRPVGAVKSLQNRGLNALRRAVPDLLHRKEA